MVLQQPKPPYLNASTITYTTPSLPHNCRYIATQGPLPTTTGDFWAMVHQLRVPAVVMLTNCAEAGVVKCGQYFPHALHSVRTEGGYEIRVSGGGWVQGVGCRQCCNWVTVEAGGFALCASSVWGCMTSDVGPGQGLRGTVMGFIGLGWTMQPIDYTTWPC